MCIVARKSDYKARRALNMLNNVTSLWSLKCRAIKIKDGEKVLIYWPQYKRTSEQEFNLENDYCVRNHSYNINQSVIAFYENKELFIIPYFPEAMDVLKREGFSRSEMLVPFSNREYPILHKSYWEELLKEAKEQSSDSYTEQCLKYSKKLGVTALPKEVLDSKCLQIPDNGIVVANPDKIEDEIMFPVINGYCCDHLTLDYLGRFCINKGVISFVNADGKQYVSKSLEVQNKLIELGYKYRNFYVIFSNGEEPVDSAIETHWKQLTEE